MFPPSCVRHLQYMLILPALLLSRFLFTVLKGNGVTSSFSKHRASPSPSYIYIYSPCSRDTHPALAYRLKIVQYTSRDTIFAKGYITEHRGGYRGGAMGALAGVLKISLAGANNLVPTTSLTPCIIIIHVYTCNYSGAGKKIDAR